MSQKPIKHSKHDLPPRSRAADARGYDDFAARSFQNPYRDPAMRRAWAAGFRRAALEHRADARRRLRHATTERAVA